MLSHLHFRSRHNPTYQAFVTLTMKSKINHILVTSKDMNLKSVRTISKAEQKRVLVTFKLKNHKRILTGQNLI